jgi:chorismate synthase
MLRYLTSGESHGEALLGILEGIPAGFKIDVGYINNELSKRQKGYGRGDRMKIESDKVKILSGVMRNMTIGSPIAFLIYNKDFSIDKLPEIKNPRPGHADLTGILKYGFQDARPVLERASARETAMRVAIGALCKQFLEQFDINILSHVIMIAGIKANAADLMFGEINKKIINSQLRCVDSNAEKLMKEKIDIAKSRKDTLGGVFEVRIKGVLPGLGSYVQPDKRIDALLAQNIMSIPSVKAVEIGEGIVGAVKFGSDVHDEIFYSSKKGFYRDTNNAGGIEGGMSNGEEIVVRGYVKPISTLMQGLRTVNIDTKKPVKAAIERSDICAVPSAGVIAEAMSAFVVTGLFLEKFGGDSFSEIKRNYNGYVNTLT